MIQSESYTEQKIDENQLLKEAHINLNYDDTYIKKVLQYIILRVRFNYGYKEILHFLTHCMCLRRFHRIHHKSHLLYKKGQVKLERELDVVNLLRSIRKLRLMAQVMLKPSELMLLKFQRKNVVEITSSSSDSDHHKYDTAKVQLVTIVRFTFIK